MPGRIRLSRGLCRVTHDEGKGTGDGAIDRDQQAVRTLVQNVRGFIRDLLERNPSGPAAEILPWPTFLRAGGKAQRHLPDQVAPPK